MAPESRIELEALALTVMPKVPEMTPENVVVTVPVVGDPVDRVALPPRTMLLPRVFVPPEADSVVPEARVMPPLPSVPVPDAVSVPSETEMAPA